MNDNHIQEFFSLLVVFLWHLMVLSLFSSFSFEVSYELVATAYR